MIWMGRGCHGSRWVVNLVALLFIMESAAFAIPYATVLRRMEERWNNLQRYQVDLLQSVEEPVYGDVRYYAGALYINRGDKLRLDYQLLRAKEPPALAVVSEWVNSASFAPDDIYLADKEMMWHHDRRAQVVTMQFLDQSGLPTILQALAGMQMFRAEEFQRNYFIRPVIEEEMNFQPSYLLRFAPKGEDRDLLSQYDLWVSQENYLPLRLRVVSHDEIVDVYLFNGRPDEPLPQNVFDIRVPDEVHWIDRTKEI